MKRCVAILIVFSMVLYMMLSLNVFATSEKLTLDKTQYEVGENINVTATGTDADWVGLYIKGETPSLATPAILWYYVAKDGNTSGSTIELHNADIKTASRSDLHSIPVEEYDLYLLENDGYTVIEKVSFKVIDSSSSKTVTTDKTVYSVGDNIYATATGSGSDWVGLYLKGETPGSATPAIVWYNVTTDGHTSGSPVELRNGDGLVKTESRSNLHSIPAGEYDIHLLENGGYTSLAKVSITVVAAEETPTKSVTTDKTEYEVGEDIYVTATGSGRDWVGSILKGRPPVRHLHLFLSCGIM